MSTKHVLLTGGTGYIAAHIIDQLIKIGGYKITATTRDLSKLRTLFAAFPHFKEALTFICVPDFTLSTAFDDTFRNADPPFDYVLHTASPGTIAAFDVVVDFIEPNVKGIESLFGAAHRFGGPHLNRIVYTSSTAAIDYSFNQVINHPDSDENNWWSVPYEQVIESKDQFMGYRYSKVAAEKAAFRYMDAHKLTFDLVTLLPNVTLGSTLIPPTKAGDIENSTRNYFHALIDGSYASVEGLEPPLGYRTVDVRDVARAHVDALTIPEASGQRIILSSPELTTPQSIVNILNNNFPDLKERIPRSASRLLPDGVVPEVIRSSKVKDIFGWEYKSLEESVVDFTKDILEAEKAWC